jgi:hypothetical protein
MDYQKIYNNLMKNATNRKLDPLEYYEKHHIIPKCHNGSNLTSNLVNLTGREHFIAHALLTKIYPQDKKIANAFIIMAANKTGKRYTNSYLYEKLKRRFNHLYSGTGHHLYGKTHTNEAKLKISKAKQGSIPVLDKDGNRFCVSKEDERYINGDVVHHSTGRKMSKDELTNHRKLRTGKKNPNANPITDDEIVAHGISFLNQSNGVWCKKDWIAYCKDNNIPITYTSMRFNGTGYNGLVDIIKNSVPIFRKINKKDYAHKIQKTNLEKKKHWYYNSDIKQTKLLTEADAAHNGWTLGRKLKWD